MEKVLAYLAMTPMILGFLGVVIYMVSYKEFRRSLPSALLMLGAAWTVIGLFIWGIHVVTR